MFNIILFEPSMPGNTGNIIRLCANTNAKLHLIEPLGFFLDDKKMRRAGLDYHEFAEMKVYSNLNECLQSNDFSEVYALSSKAEKSIYEINLKDNCAFLFGNEKYGLTENALSLIKQNNLLTVPMQENSRCLNLSNTAAIVLYEALRQNTFNF